MPKQGLTTPPRTVTLERIITKQPPLQDHIHMQVHNNRLATQGLRLRKQRTFPKIPPSD
jgi:hypothetical protein